MCSPDPRPLGKVARAAVSFELRVDRKGKAKLNPAMHPPGFMDAILESWGATKGFSMGLTFGGRNSLVFRPLPSLLCRIVAPIGPRWPWGQ